MEKKRNAHEDSMSASIDRVKNIVDVDTGIGQHKREVLIRQEPFDDAVDVTQHQEHEKDEKDQGEEFPDEDLADEIKGLEEAEPLVKEYKHENTDKEEKAG